MKLFLFTAAAVLAAAPVQAQNRTYHNIAQHNPQIHRQQIHRQPLDLRQRVNAFHERIQQQQHMAGQGPHVLSHCKSDPNTRLVCSSVRYEAN